MKHQSTYPTYRQPTQREVHMEAADICAVLRLRGQLITTESPRWLLDYHMTVLEHLAYGGSPEDEVLPALLDKTLAIHRHMWVGESCNLGHDMASAWQGESPLLTEHGMISEPWVLAMLLKELGPWVNGGRRTGDRAVLRSAYARIVALLTTYKVASRGQPLDVKMTFPSFDAGAYRD